MKSILGEAEYEANLYDWKEEGLAEGRAEGKEEGIRQVAAKMKSLGIPLKQIADATGLPEESIEELI